MRSGTVGPVAVRLAVARESARTATGPGRRPRERRPAWRDVRGEVHQPGSGDHLCADLVRRRVEPEVALRTCLLYTSDAADDLLCVDLGGRRIIKKKKQTI